MSYLTTDLNVPKLDRQAYPKSLSKWIWIDPWHEWPKPDIPMLQSLGFQAVLSPEASLVFDSRNITWKWGPKGQT